MMDIDYDGGFIGENGICHRKLAQAMRCLRNNICGCGLLLIEMNGLFGHHQTSMYLWLIEEKVLGFLYRRICGEV
ncbi:MAG: hypothetical protein K2J67_04000 [Lachnospiraceae bacterium]|nr:hypothetical protein [Lachnospiraceae bacterium]